MEKLRSVYELIWQDALIAQHLQIMRPMQYARQMLIIQMMQAMQMRQTMQLMRKMQIMQEQLIMLIRQVLQMWQSILKGDKAMCEKCGNDQCGNAKRIELGVFATKEAIDSLTLIQTRISNADQACRIDSLPENTRPEIATAYFKAAIEAKSDAQFLMNDWWKNTMQDEKLKNKGNVYIDFDTSEFYILEA